MKSSRGGAVAEDVEFGWLGRIRRLEEAAILMGDGHGPERSEHEDVLGAEWERHRPAVFGVAYRLLGAWPMPRTWPRTCGCGRREQICGTSAI